MPDDRFDYTGRFERGIFKHFVTDFRRKKPNVRLKIRSTLRDTE